MSTIFESPRPLRTQIRFEVSLHVTGMFDKIAKFEVKELERITRYASNVDIPEVEDVKKYIANLLYFRVLKANDERIPGEMRGPLHDLYIPSRWYVMLDNVGQAHDWKRNMKFKPVFELDAALTMSKDEMIAVSEKLQSFKLDGYNCEKGLPEHVEGSLDFMAKVSLANGQALALLRGMDVTNPVFAFFCEVFQNEIVGYNDREIDMMFRIEYSAPNKYQSSFTDYYREFQGEMSKPNDSKDLPGGNSNKNKDGKGPSQPQPGTEPPDLGHNGNGAITSAGNIKD